MNLNANQAKRGRLSRLLRNALLPCLAISLGLLARSSYAGDNTLRFYNWAGYIAPTTVPDFEKATGVHVTYDIYESNSTLFAKLVAGDSGYDLVVPSSNWAAIDIKGGLLHPIDKSKIPNYKNLNPQLMKELATIDPGNKYLVPWMWGYTTVGINVDEVRKALGSTPMPDNPWSLVFDPKYADKLKSCGLSYLDSPMDLMEAAFVYMGIPQSTTNPSDFKRAWDMMERVRGDIHEFANMNYVDDMAHGSICAAIGWNGGMGIGYNRANQAHNGVHLKIFPPTHGAVVFIDTLAIPSDAKDVDNAYKFINYRLQPKVCAADTNTTFYANPVPASLPYVNKAIRDNGFVFIDSAMMDKLRPPKVYTTEQRRVVTRLYTKFKTGL